MMVHQVQVNLGANREKFSETLKFGAVSAKSYPSDGLDEDNTFAKFTPMANLEMTIANPELWDKFSHGDKFYLDFTPAE